MQAIGQRPSRAPCLARDGARLHCERHRPEKTTMYRGVQEHAASFFAQAGAATSAGLPEFMKDKFDAFLECGILARGFLRLRCADRGQGEPVDFGCKLRGSCSSCAARRMPQTAAHLVDPVIPMRRCVGGCCRCPFRCACSPRSRNS